VEAVISDEVALVRLMSAVKDMRKLQKDYFRGRRDVIEAAKASEKRVDKLIVEIEDKQGKLFE